MTAHDTDARPVQGAAPGGGNPNGDHNDPVLMQAPVSSVRSQGRSTRADRPDRASARAVSEPAPEPGSAQSAASGGFSVLLDAVRALGYTCSFHGGDVSYDADRGVLHDGARVAVPFELTAASVTPQPQGPGTGAATETGTPHTGTQHLDPQHTGPGPTRATGATWAGDGGVVRGTLLAARLDGRPVTAAQVQALCVLVEHACAAGVAGQLRGELEIQRVRVAHLELALTSNREIGVAIGIVMSARRCTEEEAFTVLRAASQNSNRKIRDIAAVVAYTGEAV